MRTAIREFVSRCLALIDRRRSDAQLNDEIRTHLDLLTDEHIRRGMTPDEARATARRDFGGVDQIKEQYRDQRGLPLLDAFRQDTLSAWRSLQRNRTFAVVSILTLALGIGATTAVYSLIDRVLLRPLPYSNPSRLVEFLFTSPQGAGPYVSPAAFNLWRLETETFSHVSAYRFNVMNLTGPGDPEQVAAGQVSHDFFALFGAPIIAGQTFTPDDDRPDGARVVVLSEGFWNRRFGRGQNTIGHYLTLNDQRYEIRGIIGRFDASVLFATASSPDVWIPFQIDPASVYPGTYFFAAGRLRDGVTIDRANARLAVVAGDARHVFAERVENGFAVQALQDFVVGPVRVSLWVLMSAVACVLMIAVANVANLSLARTLSRTREIAIRTAIGASRARLVRQLLTESGFLSCLGAAGGQLLAWIGLRAAIAAYPGTLPLVGPAATDVRLDGRMLAFVVMTTVMCGLLSGLAPALVASRNDLGGLLHEGGGGSSVGIRSHKARAGLIVSQISLALVLLVGAALLIRSYAALRAVKPGFEPRNVLTLRTSLTGPTFARTANVASLLRNGAASLMGLPDVEAVGASQLLPLEGNYGLSFSVVGRPPAGRVQGYVGWIPISPGYFPALQIPVLRGRAFTDRDDERAQGVVVINEAMARAFWPQSDPLADQLILGRGAGPLWEEGARQVIGVVGDVHQSALNGDQQPTVYIPWAQQPDARSAHLLEEMPITWIVRTRGTRETTVASVRATLRRATGGLPIGRVRTMADVVAQSTARGDFETWLLTAFGAAALLLAAVGLYGLVAYVGQQRARELGIRAALGADSRMLRNMILRQGLTLAALGILIGTALAHTVTRVLTSMLFGVTSHDPTASIAVSLLLMAVALGASWIPARRASRIDPLVTLRRE
jgi:putative ABC transport system permease protein